MTTPLQFGDPPALGPFQLHGRLWEGPAGIAYLGSDQLGRQVSVALLTRGAATDAAARDRFRAAISGGQGVDRPGPPVLAADPDGPAPWVATGYDPQQPGAERFLDPVAMTDAASGMLAGEGRGPDFQPHWAGATRPAAPPPPMPAAQPGGGSRLGLLALGIVAGVVVLVLVVAGGLILMARNEPAPNPSPRAQANSPAATSAAPSPAATGGGANPSAVPLRTNGPKVVGATWGPGDQTYTMDDLEGLGFSFRVPDAWGCMQSQRSSPPNYRWVCIDEQSSFAGQEDVAGFVVLVGPCAAPCDAEQREKMRGGLEVEGEWRETDDTTAYAEWTATENGTDFYNLALSHFWHKDGGNELNSYVVAVGDAPMKDKVNLRKTFNDIRANTP